MADQRQRRALRSHYRPDLALQLELDLFTVSIPELELEQLEAFAID